MKLLLIISVIMCSSMIYSQEAKAKLYNPEADAKYEIKEAIAIAKDRGKHVFIQVGGNWCSWCKKFNKFLIEDEELYALFNANYVAVKVNYDQEVKNEDVLAELDYPQRFGFPVFVILDGDGKRLHTQDTGLLEDGLGYDKRKIVQFFRFWAKSALDPNNYRDK